MSNIVWTKHAEERNKERQITVSWVEQTVNNPDKTRDLGDGKVEYRKNFDKQTVSVISTKSGEGKYLILSSWVNPPNAGTLDYKNNEYSKNMKKSGNLRKFWLTILRQLGFN